MSTPCIFFVVFLSLFFNMLGFHFRNIQFPPKCAEEGWGKRKSDLGKERNGKERVFGCSPLPRTEEEEEGKTEKATNGC